MTKKNKIDMTDEQYNFDNMQTWPKTQLNKRFVFIKHICKIKFFF